MNNERETITYIYQVDKT